MDIIPRAQLNRIPGELIKTKADKYTQDITKLTLVQLIEIKEREEMLLAKKSQLARLPDKGQKIKDFYAKILSEISQRDEIDKAAAIFSELNIAKTGQEKLNNLEWTGKLNPEANKEILLDSDDEETDPLKIIAQSTDTKKKIIHLVPEETLITQEDLKDIEEIRAQDSSTESNQIIDSELVDIQVSNFIHKKKLNQAKPNSSLSSSYNESGSSNNSLNLEPHTLYLLDFEESHGFAKKEKFLPYKTTKTNVHDPEKEKHRKTGGKHWENTAATPPPIQHNGTQLLALKDAVEIQADYNDKLKKLQERHAAERLMARAARTQQCNITLPDEQIRKVNKFFGSYRHKAESELNSDESENELIEKIDSDEGVHDDEEEKGGCVNFKVYD